MVQYRVYGMQGSHFVLRETRIQLGVLSIYPRRGIVILGKVLYFVPCLVALIGATRSALGYLIPIEVMSMRIE